MAEKKDRLSLEENKEKYDTKFALCLVCQKDTNENLVRTPSSETTTTLLKAIEIRAGYGDTFYPEKWKRLQKQTSHDTHHT